jgi:hypothetical protein
VSPLQIELGAQVVAVVTFVGQQLARALFRGGRGISDQLLRWIA